MKIPNKFEEIIKQDQSLHSLVLDVVNDNSFGRILKDNKLFFFEEYTEHGIEHIEMVLKAAEFLIPDESFLYIKPKEVAILILAVVLHDIGMHTEFSTFKAMIDGKYDNEKGGALIDILDKKAWKELWEDYLSEVRHFSSKQKENVFGNPNEIVNELDLSNKDKLNGTDKKLIGEFIRRYHARLAHEIALKGFIGNETIPFGNENLSEQDRQFAGIVARSHGMNIRDTFEYLKEIAYDDWKNPADMNIVFLMVLLRIADYLQINKTRTDKTLLKLKTFNSPISLREHQTHLAISYLTFQKEDPELISVTAEPKDAQMYVKIQNLIKDIQHEFDLSWAILGETYGFLPDKKPKIKFRRITSNLEHSAFLKKINYVPEKIAFEVNNDVAKLLVAPLYGNAPTYGVRELVQNSTDACKERMKIEQDKGNTNYEPLVTVSIDKIDEEKYLFSIKDNGKGMTLDEILNYFLSVGSSFRKNLDWKKEFEGKVSRNGRFGIGVLAAFLLGDEISVKTRSYKENITFSFKTKCDSGFVEIEKQYDNFEIGTEIEILINNLKFTELMNKKEFRYGEISWTDWYIHDIPRVRYLLDGNEQCRQYRFISHQEFTPQCYGKIQWEYFDDHDYFKEKEEYYVDFGQLFNFIACNGILITANFDGNLHLNSFMDSLPSINIEDPHGILPISLDRNDLEKELPFEEELIKEVSKDIIAKLLCKEKKVISPSIHFLYFKKGFTLNSDYFANKIYQHKYIIKSITELDEKGYYEHIGWDKIYFPDLIQQSSENCAIFCGFGAVFPQMFEKYNQHEFTYCQEGTEILNGLLQYYFGDNIIIPYDIEERKKLYPLAFEELKDYMKDYEKI